MVSKFFKWIFKSEEPTTTKSSKLSIEELRRMVDEATKKTDGYLRSSEQKFLDENKEEYKLVVSTDTEVFESESYGPSAIHHCRTRHTFMHDEYNRLMEIMSFGVYDYAIPEFTKALDVAEKTARNILMPGSTYYDKKSGIMVSSKDIKSVKIVKLEVNGEKI